MYDLKSLLALSVSRHSHLCPRQVLGVRTALAGAIYLDLEMPRHDKRLLVVVESDGCYVDGLEVVTGVSIGHRTLRVVDYGKIAATFVDVNNERAVRIAARQEARHLARQYAPMEKRPYTAQLLAYQVMPDDQLFRLQSVRLDPPVKALISHPGFRTVCMRCGEEIINQRQIKMGGAILCRACADSAYYTVMD